MQALNLPIKWRWNFIMHMDHRIISMLPLDLVVQALKVVFRYWLLYVYTAKHLHHPEMPLTKPPLKQMMGNPWPAIKTIDDLAKWCAMPTRELQKHLTWCFRLFPNITDYVNHNQTRSRPNDTVYIGYNAVAIPVSSFQDNNQAVHSVRLTRYTMGTEKTPPRNDAVFLWKWWLPDRHF